MERSHLLAFLSIQVVCIQSDLGLRPGFATCSRRGPGHACPPRCRHLCHGRHGGPHGAALRIMQHRKHIKCLLEAPPSWLGCGDNTQCLGHRAGDTFLVGMYSQSFQVGRHVMRRQPPPAGLRLGPTWSATATSLLLISFPTRFPKGIQAPPMNDAWPSRVAWGQASPLLARCPHPGRQASVSSPV